MGPIEHNSTYPLSSEPAEGYGGKPQERSGKVILTNATNGKHICVTNEGFEHVANRESATKFNDHAEAALKAADLITKIKAKQAAAQIDQAA